MDGNKENRANRLHVFFVSGRAIVAAILLVAVVLLTSSNRFWRWMYPIRYQGVIQYHAAQVHVDPLLVASVIRVESKFDPNDVSSAGAIGLMQLMPPTAQWIASMRSSKAPNLKSISLNADIRKPTVNIALGTWYIQYLIARFHGNEVAAIGAYNAGPQRVSNWLSSGTWNGRLSSIMSIPVGETRHFIDRVFYNFTLYKRIYGEDHAWQTKQ